MTIFTFNSSKQEDSDLAKVQRHSVYYYCILLYIQPQRSRLYDIDYFYSKGNMRFNFLKLRVIRGYFLYF